MRTISSPRQPDCHVALLECPALRHVDRSFASPSFDGFAVSVRLLGCCLGSQAILRSAERLDPLALRPWLLPGLPFLC